MKRFVAAALIFAATVCGAFAEAGVSAPVTLPSASVLPQGGEAKFQEGVFALISGDGTAAFDFKFHTGAVFDKIILEHSAGLSNWTAYFVFQREGQSEISQGPVKVKGDQVFLGETFDASEFVFFGLVLRSNAVAFSDVRPGLTDFSDAFDTLMEPELLIPPTINLLYGHYFWSLPAVMILGIFVLLVAGLLAVFGLRKAALATVLICWFAYDLLLMRDQYLVMKTTDETFLSPANAEDRTYFDFGNLYAFVDETKKCLDGKEGGVNFYAPSHWPFDYNFEYHMVPRRRGWQTAEHPFYAAFAGGEVKDGKFYYRGKLVDEDVTLLCSLKGGSVILQKNNR